MKDVTGARVGLCTSREARAGRLEWKGHPESVGRRNNEDHSAQSGMVGQMASRWSVAVVRAVAAVCVGRSSSRSSTVRARWGDAPD